ncbi:hypothetical protein [Francisella tularensis]|uniref:hypothetical protein n=1 Tax=Francisella tularensis TaxID=263 RepID=UPI001560B574|nr:hypothetical protein [Francisella tularensis]
MEVLSWQESVNYIKKINPDLAALIVEIDPHKRCKFIKAKYNFGDYILKKGVLHLPYKGKLLPIDSRELPKEVVDEISYSRLPLGIPLNKKVELFLEEENLVCPYVINQPGKLFGLRSLLHEDFTYQNFQKNWNMVAGSRSLYFQTNLLEQRSFNRLAKEFSFKFAKPNHFQEQWNLFKLISNNQENKQLWVSEILYFSSGWLNKEYNDLYKFKNFFSNSIMEILNFMVNVTGLKFQLLSANKKANLKIDSYALSTIFHLYGISKGFYPGFAISDETSAPITRLERTFMDIYLSKNVPIFFSPEYIYNVKSLYYTFRMPTIIESVPKLDISLISYMKEFDYICKKLISKLKDDTKYEFLIRELTASKYELFHLDKFLKDGFIKPLTQLYQEDENFQKIILKYPSLKMCQRTPFLGGCVKITNY